jgi:acyl-coenzyme A synthetase/AMP-(fatty) acid ligase
MSVRAELAADPELGVGNVLSRLVARGEGLDEPLLTFDTPVGGHPAWQPLTLRQLDELTAARAAWLVELGARPREPVAVHVGAAAEQVLSFLALTRIGAIPALINAKVDGRTARAYLERLRPTGLLLDAAHRAQLGAEEVAGLGWQADVADAPADAPAAPPEQFRHHPDDAAVITHSSGTTGLPKAVIATHASLFASVRHRLTLPRPRATERMLSALPANHAAMVIALSLALCNRAELAMLSEQSGAAVREGITRFRPSCVLGFAATWPELLAQDPSADELESVQLWWNTGDCAHEAHIRRLVSFGHRVVASREGARRQDGSAFIDGLGSTEMGHSMFFITHTSDTDRYRRCIGRPHAFAEVAALDAAGDEVPPGTVGQLGVRSPTLSPGYWNDSVTTYRTRLRGYFLTGDLVYRDEEGYYYHVDRAVDALDLGDGRRLYTAQSEERILAACPDVLDCTVVAVRSAAGRPTSTVLLTLAPGADPGRDREAEVRAALDPQVADTVERVLVVGDGELPHGPTGKVRKVLLRDDGSLLAERGTHKEEVNVA